MGFDLAVVGCLQNRVGIGDGLAQIVVTILERLDSLAPGRGLTIGVRGGLRRQLLLGERLADP